MDVKKIFSSLRFAAIAAGLTGGLFTLGAPTARAQDALGAGDALDANLSIDGTSNIPSVDTTQAFRVRNLLVTGNVAGGREFRESVGYTAAEDFRGALGSDDIFRFQADSAYSAPNYVLYKDQLTDIRIGQDLGTLEFRRASTVPNIQGSPFNSRVYDSSRELGAASLRLDRLISDVSLSQEIERASESRPMAVAMNAEGQPIVPMATSILGLQTLPLEDVRRSAGMSVLDRARMLQEQQQMPPGTQQTVEPYNMKFADLLSNENRVQPQSAETRIDNKDSSYEVLMREVAQRYAGVEQLTTDKLSELDTHFTDLKNYLRGDLPATEPGETLPGEVPLDTQPSDPLLPSTQVPDDAQPADPTNPVPVVVDPTRGVIPTLDSFGIALRHGQVITTYATGNDDRFTELVKQAEESLAAGEYFWAERRFQRALRFQQNHPLATAGRGHAQLGAGLYLPAALTLKFVLARYPELIDLRYSPSLLPPDIRLGQNIEAVRERVDQGVDGADMGFLLAYIGHQTGNRTLVEEGLSSFEEHEPNDRLLPLLKSVWLGERIAPGAMQPAEK